MLKPALLVTMLLFHACAPEGDPVDEAMRSIRPDWVMQRLSALSSDEMAGRGNGTAGGELARQYLVDEMEALGLEPAGSDGYNHAFAQGVNLVGRLPGSDPAKAGEHILVTAHYDHLGSVGDEGSQCELREDDDPEDLICNGAGDNASGCVAALAVVKALAEGRQRPRHSVLLVFFDAEEDGLLGSLSWTGDNPPLPLDSIVAVLNIDTIGVTFIPGFDGTLALGVDFVPELIEQIEGMNQRVDIATYPASSFFDGSEDGSRSDHFPFRLKGVPALFFTAGVPAEYHSTRDQAGIIDSDKLLQTTRHIFLMAQALSQAKLRPICTAESVPHIGDAVALVQIGQAILADPAAMGLDATTTGILESWIQQLQSTLADPPQTEEEWDEYESFVRSILIAASLFWLG